MTSSVSFSDLGVESCLVHTLEEQGITEPFEVQLEAIPDGMLGRNVCCRAPTGSGKTLAFGLPLISRCKRARPNLPTSLVLTPTRELAEQICSVLTPLAWEVDLEVLSIYGGTSYAKQRRALDRGVDIVVACPGRLIDLMQNGTLSLKEVDIIVIDEADRMADMGFMEPVCDILDKCASKRQTILYSATLDDEVADLVRDYLTDPVTIEVGPKDVSMDSMQHLFWLMRNSMKSEIASEAVRKCGRSIVFCRTRAGVDRVGEEFEDCGLSVATLHGGLSQRERDRAMRRFTDGDCIALIATDVAARGIDVQDVACIIHYDPSENGKAYKHRSGRTARAGAQGVVISLVQKPQKRISHRVQREAGIHCEFTPPDFTALPQNEVGYFPPPSPRRQNTNRQRQRNGRNHRGNSSYSHRNGSRNRSRNSNDRNHSGGQQRHGGQRNAERKHGGQSNDRQRNGGHQNAGRRNHGKRSNSWSKGGQGNGGRRAYGSNKSHGTGGRKSNHNARRPNSQNRGQRQYHRR